MLDRYVHGGDLYSLAEELNISENLILDFSSSINPFGVSKKVKRAIIRGIDSIKNYPDPKVRKLTEILAERINVEKSSIICGNGATELIYLTIRALKPDILITLSPSFVEYERAFLIFNDWKDKNIHYFNLKEENLFQVCVAEFIQFLRRVRKNSENAKIVGFLCNPNNPTGTYIDRERLIEISEEARKLNIYMIVDESFLEFIPQLSLADITQKNPYVGVISSMTKFYALPGLRIGYGVFNPSLAISLQKYKEPWSVNALAQIAACEALTDHTYVKLTHSIIYREKKWLERHFRRLNIKFFASATNFYLLKHSKAQEIIRILRQRGILLRDCSNFRGLGKEFFRVAVKKRKENKILIKELSNICQQY